MRASNEPDFSTTITLDCTPRQAFDAINNVSGWWSENVDGATDHLHAEFTFRYKDVHYTKQRVVEFVPGKRVKWRILESSLNFVEDPHEWKGSDICFDITRHAGATEIRFTHVGLVPERECYEACSNAWRYYVGDSLRNLIATGQGEPDERE